VVTQPDRPQGRGGKMARSPVKAAATIAGLTIHQPDKVRSRAFVEQVREIAPDALVVAAFGQIIPQAMLDIPPYGSINLHGSVLPRWRGAAPMQYALMAGDAETGVTTMLMDAGLDTGDILLQTRIALADEDNLGTLEPKLAEVGATLLIETLRRLAAGDCLRIPQDSSAVTLAPSLPPDTGAIDWRRPATEIHNLVRGVTPRPGAFFLWQGKRVKVWKTRLVEDIPAGDPGRLEKIGSQGITVSTGDGALDLVDVQPESKARMPADAWVRGARLTAGLKFDLKAQA
jgi:methionyl-tRNA formyltransferase